MSSVTEWLKPGTVRLRPDPGTRLVIGKAYSVESLLPAVSRPGA